MERDVFKGKQVRLAAITEDDLPLITQWYQSSTFQRLFDAIPATLHTQAHWQDWLNDLRKDNHSYTFGIRTLADDQFIGWIQLEGILWANQVGGLTVAIADPDQRGKGYGYDAISVLLDYAFNELNLYRVQLTVFAYNTRAIRLYERLGFTREGAFRDGKRHDMILYGMLRQEWHR